MAGIQGWWGGGGIIGWRDDATRTGCSTAQSLCQTLLACEAAVWCEGAFVFTLATGHGGSTGWGSVEESAGSQSHTLGSVDGVHSGGWIEAVAGVGVATSGSGEIVVSFLHSAVEKVEIDVGVVRAGTTESHVGRTLGESLHWCSADTSSVAVGVAGIEWTIVMEHYCS